MCESQRAVCISTMIMVALAVKPVKCSQIYMCEWRMLMGLLFSWGWRRMGKGRGVLGVSR